MIREILRRFYRTLVPLLYSRSNYKLFLQRSFEGLDARISATMCATNVLPSLIRPVPVRAPFGRSMLVVAPHQDDEIIGCGGAMLLQRKSGGDLFVVFTQDGGDEHDEDGRTREQQVAIREAEASHVAREMGIPSPRFLRYRTLSGDEERALAADLRSEIEGRGADVVFTPFFLDYNLHHQRTNFALAEALAAASKAPTVFCYEVWGLTVPNVVLNIDDVQEEKRRLLGLYPSQMSGTDYVHAITGLNMFHSIHFGAGECRFAERFLEIPAEDYVRVVRAIRSQVTREGSDTPMAF